MLEYFIGRLFLVYGILNIFFFFLKKIEKNSKLIPFIFFLKGVVPLSFIHVHAGETIHKFSETDEFSFLTTQNIVTLSLVAVATLIPTMLRKRFESQENNITVESKKTE
jgi:hypothetical protein